MSGERHQASKLGLQLRGPLCFNGRGRVAWSFNKVWESGSAVTCGRTQPFTVPKQQWGIRFQQLGLETSDFQMTTFRLAENTCRTAGLCVALRRSS